MIRLYIKLMLPIVIVFVMLSLIARALGTTQLPNPALRGFSDGCENQPQPCWNGIISGVTTERQTNAILEVMGYELNETIDIYGGQHMHSYRSATADCYLVVLYYKQAESPIEGPIVSCTHVQLGDAIARFGLPDYMMYLNRDPNLWFGDHLEARMYGEEAWTSPRNPILAFALSAEGHPDDPDYPPIHWHGVVNRKRYCQIEYVQSYCLEYIH